MSDNNFFRRVSELDSGSQASLRHSAGVMLNEADGKAFTAFYKAYPPKDAHGNKIEEKYFFSACIQCLWKPDELSKAISIEQALAKLTLISEGDSDTYLKRIQGLININWDGYMAAKIYRLAKLCKSKGFVIDCDLLAQDLVQWNYTDKKVQKKWVCAICDTQKILNETKGDNNYAI